MTKPEALKGPMDRLPLRIKNLGFEHDIDDYASHVSWLLGRGSAQRDPGHGVSLVSPHGGRCLLQGGGNPRPEGGRPAPARWATDSPWGKATGPRRGDPAVPPGGDEVGPVQAGEPCKEYLVCTAERHPGKLRHMRTRVVAAE